MNTLACGSQQCSTFIPLHQTLLLSGYKALLNSGGPILENIHMDTIIPGEYSCLSVDLIFKRQFSYYLITIYVPGCMLVIVSWVSFWLDAHAVPARVALGVTTLLTMSTQTASINSALPPVAYTKAIDVWQVSTKFHR